MKKILYLHQKDLRIHDNAALAYATQHDFIPVYIFSEQHTCSSHQNTLITHAVHALKETYAANDVELITQTGSVREIVTALCEKHSITEICTQERADNQKLLSLLRAIRPIQTFITHTLHETYPPHKHPFSAWLQTIREKPLKPVPVPASFRQELESRSTMLQHTQKQQLQYPEIYSEQEALSHLRTYLETKKINGYKQTRNELEAAGSYLSIPLSQGLLSVRKIYADIRAYEQQNKPNEGTKHLLYELYWREYAHQTYTHRKEIHPNKPVRTIMPQLNHPLLCAIQQELEQTGYITNRARQILANALAKKYAYEWDKIEHYFAQHLIDYDRAINAFNTAYQAGILDPRDRIFNLDKQQEQYDPEHTYIHKWMMQKE